MPEQDLLVQKEYDALEAAIAGIIDLLKHDYGISKRMIAVLLIQEDQEIRDLVIEKEPSHIMEIEKIITGVKTHYSEPIEYLLALRYRNKAKCVSAKTVKVKYKGKKIEQWLDTLMMNPWTGFPILLLVLYFGLYQFVGVFGAGTVVDFIETNIFEQNLNPLMTHVVKAVVPWKLWQDLFVGEYGVLTLGLRYAMALILPIVTFFFIAFSVVEDTGYLPRLAMLLDRIFKKIGLSGRAVIPMVMGLGCDTMATLVTRTLPTRRERVIATLLLALAIPCSAQLGVILALLSGHPKAMLLWAGVVAFIFLFIGFLAAQFIPGAKTSFYMELPPLRLPHLSNVLTKTYVRVRWYFQEIFPLFLWVSVFIWFGQLTKIFDVIINLLQKPVILIGLPSEAAKIFLFGFFRRDYGAAGLYDLSKQGILSMQQLVVASVALTLFLPCIAQFLINLKERGWKTGCSISAFILFFSFFVAYVLNILLTRIGIPL